MDAFHIFLILLDVAIWLLLLSLNALPITKPQRSKFELMRRKSGGDAAVEEDIARLEAHDRLRALRNLLVTICIVVISVLSVFGFGWLLGVVVAVSVLLTSDRLSQVAVLRHLVRTQYANYESRIIEWTLGSSWIDWFVASSNQAETSPLASKEELLNLLSQDHSFLNRDEYDRLVAGMAFDDKQIKDVMTPASMIDTARRDDVLGPLVLDELHKTGHSRFPVIEGDIHHIVGILYIHNLLNTNDHKKTVKTAMETDVHYIHEAQTLAHALHGFLRTHRHLFIVVNDYRETVGVISLEDVLEALIGNKIVDEFDRFDDLRLVAESNPHKNNMPRGKKDI